jgi:hypothetical protein
MILDGISLLDDDSVLLICTKVTGWLSTCDSKREQFYGKCFVLPYITEFSLHRILLSEQQMVYH